MLTESFTARDPKETITGMRRNGRDGQKGPFPARFLRLDNEKAPQNPRD